MTSQDNQRYQQAEQRMNKHLPRVRFDIEEDDDATGISAISIVDKPAIESDFIAFSKRRRTTDAGRQRYERAKRRMAEIELRRVLSGKDG